MDGGRCGLPPGRAGRGNGLVGYLLDRPMGKPRPDSARLERRGIRSSDTLKRANHFRGSDRTSPRPGILIARIKPSSCEPKRGMMRTRAKFSPQTTFWRASCTLPVLYATRYMDSPSRLHDLSSSSSSTSTSWLLPMPHNHHRFLSKGRRARVLVLANW